MKMKECTSFVTLLDFFKHFRLFIKCVLDSAITRWEEEKRLNK